MSIEPVEKRRRILKLLLGILTFSVLMSIHTQFEQLWARALIAGCGGGILGWTILQARRNK